MARPIAVLCLLGLSLLPSSAGATVVHGLSHAALGSATVSSVPSPTGPALEIGNIGSSGQDGVAIDLACMDGYTMRFGAPAPSPAPPIWDSRSEIWRGTGGTTITIVGSSFRTRNAMGQVEVGMDVPGATEMEVELWIAGRMVASTTVPAGTTIIRNQSSGEVCDDGDLVDLRITRSQDDGTIKSYLEATHVFAMPASADVDGVSFTSNRYVMRAGIPMRFDPVMQGRVLASTGSGGGSGGVLHLSAERLAYDPPTATRPEPDLGASIEAVSGVVLTGVVPRSVAPVSDGTGAPPVLKIGGGITKSDVEGNNLNWMFGSRFAPMRDPVADEELSVTIEAVGSYDPNTGSPPHDVTHGVTWTSTTPGFWSHTVYSDDPSVSVQTMKFRGGGVVLHESPGVTYATSKSARRHTVSGQTNTPGCTATIGYPGGTVITISGQQFVADEVQIVYGHGTGGTLRGLRDVIVRPPNHDPEALVITGATSAPSGQAVHAGGRGTFGNGPRQTTSMDGSLYRVENIGSSGQDGVTVPFDGVPSVDFRIPATGWTDAQPPLSYSFRTYPCSDGSCAPSSSLMIDKSAHAIGESIAMSVIGTALGRLWIQAGGQTYPFHVADADGDGRADFTAVGTPLIEPIARISYQEYPDDVQSSQRWEVGFHQTVTVQTPSGPTQTQSAVITRDVLKDYFQTGDVPTQDQFASLNGLPPGVPYEGYYKVAMMRLEEPGLYTTTCAAPGIPITIHGEPFASTAVKATGAMTIRKDDDCDGIVVAPTDFFDPASPPVIEAISNLPNMRGFAATFDLPALAASPDVTSLEVLVRGTYDGHLNDVWRVMASTGGGASSLSLLPLGGSPPEPNEWAVQSSFGGIATFSDLSVMSFTSPPSAIAIGDLDRDGYPDLRCMGFPPGTEATVGGTSYPCGEVRIRITDNPTLTSLDFAALRLGAMNGGVERVMLARLASANEIVAVDPLPVAGAPLALAPAAPNPFGEATSVRFALAEAGHVRARVVDVAGREVARLADARFEAGTHALRWDGRTQSGTTAPAGLYFVRVERAGGATATTRVARLR